MFLILFGLFVLTAVFVGSVTMLYLLLKCIGWIFGEPAKPAVRRRPLHAPPEKPPFVADARIYTLNGYAARHTPPASEGPAPLEAARPPRDPARIRQAIQKLHDDAQAPAPPETLAEAETSEDREVAELLASASRLAEEEAFGPKPERRLAATAPRAPKKSLAERLFTPENVRILQSLGIGIIFVSAVAFVRMRLWEASGAWGQVSILLLGTLACWGAGYALRRWTSLRLTGLGFLILAQLAIVLDAYALVAPPAIYPLAPSSLWTVALALFSISAWFHARKLQEPLFDAFTLFGALASWGAGLAWAGVSWRMLPAGFVPALLLCGALGEALKPRALGLECGPQGWPRWSLPWWLAAAWISGAWLLALLLPAAALVTPRAELLAQLGWHHAAMLALAAGLLAWSWRARTVQAAHLGAALLLLQGPLIAWAQHWAWPRWPLALALPGTLVALTGWAYARAAIRDAGEAIAAWGGAAILLGAAWALGLRAHGIVQPGQMLWIAASLAAFALGWAYFAREKGSAWFAAAAAGFLVVGACDAQGLSAGWWPAAWLAAALLARGAWTVLARLRGETLSDGGWAFDLLASLAAGSLCFHAPFLPSQIAATTPAVCAGWWALAAYLLIGAWFAQPQEGRAWRAGLGLAVLSPALAYLFYARGAAFGAPAVWIALLAVAMTKAAMRRASDEARRWNLAACAAVLAHAVLLAGWQIGSGLYLSAALALAILAAAPALGAHALRAASHERSLAEVCEVLALALLASAGINLALALPVKGVYWSPALNLLAAMVLGLARFGSFLGIRSGGEAESRPWQRSGTWVALVLAGAAVGAVLVAGEGAPALRLTLAWSGTLVPIFIAFRPGLRKEIGERDVATLAAVAVAFLGLACACLLAFEARFWMPRCLPALRGACALLFAYLLALGGVTGWLRFAGAPVAAALGVLGLTGCVFGHWPNAVPVESFGLICAAQAGLFALLAIWLRDRSERHLGLMAPAAFCAAGFACVGALHMLAGLVFWPASPAQAWAVAAWWAMAVIAWQATRAEPRGVGAWLAALTAGGMTMLAGGHALRALGGNHAQFGPLLAGGALLMLALREMLARTERDLTYAEAGPASEEPVVLAPREAARELRAVLHRRMPSLLAGRGGGLLAAAALGACGALLAGGIGWLAGEAWAWGGTLGLLAALGAALAVLARRDAPYGAPLGLGLELAAFALLAGALGIAHDAAGWGWLSPSMWSLVGAVFVVLGMAGESAAGGLLSAARRTARPGPFVESRHLAAMALGGVSVLAACARHAPLEAPAVHELWRALWCAAVLGIYGSMAGWSADAGWRSAGRASCAALSYLVLIPAGYLALLKAHSTGSSWGGLWFLALCPLLLGAAGLLKRDGSSVQAAFARAGAGLVAAGAVWLAFAGNRENLAEVPLAVFGCLALLALAARWVVARQEEPALGEWSLGRTYTVAALLALTGAALYAARALCGMHAFGHPQFGIWEMPAWGVLGAACSVLGGAGGLERDRSGRSLVAQFGLGLAATAMVLAATHWLRWGPSASFLAGENTARLDAFVLTLLTFAGACLAARRWLGFVRGDYFACAATALAYVLHVWTVRPEAWEWYTLPLGALLFAWARSKAREEGGTAEPAEVNAILAAACALTLAPSFLQALPYGPATLPHFYLLAGAGLAMVGGAMATRRKVPLLAGSAAVLLLMAVKTAQWAAHREAFYPLMGMLLGFAVLALGCLFESKMNRALRGAVERARAEARMFWVSWE